MSDSIETCVKIMQVCDFDLTDLLKVIRNSKFLAQRAAAVYLLAGAWYESGSMELWRAAIDLIDAQDSITMAFCDALRCDIASDVYDAECEDFRENGGGTWVGWRHAPMYSIHDGGLI